MKDLLDDAGGDQALSLHGELVFPLRFDRHQRLALVSKLPRQSYHLLYWKVIGKIAINILKLSFWVFFVKLPWPVLQIYVLQIQLVLKTSCICICICNLVTYPTPMACMKASKFSLSVNWNFPHTCMCNLCFNWDTKIKVLTCYCMTFWTICTDYLIIAFSFCPIATPKW